MESKYTTSKGILPDEIIQEMRDAFRRSEPLLDQTYDAQMKTQNAETRMQQPHQMIIALERAEEMISQDGGLWPLCQTTER